MAWYYLTQFWNLITEEGGYSVAWFQSLGNAVAGALGGFLDTIFHSANDLFVFVSWLGYCLKMIFLSLLSPISYFFDVLRFFFGTAFTTPSAPEITYTFSDQVMAVFTAVPHWTILASVLGAIIIMICGIGCLKLLLKT